jgi:hypothetical protein
VTASVSTMSPGAAFTPPSAAGSLSLLLFFCHTCLPFPCAPAVPGTNSRSSKTCARVART